MLSELVINDNCAIHRVQQPEKTRVNRFIISTEESRRICNDPLFCGMAYTRGLQKTCTSVLGAMHDQNQLVLKESETIVFNILRGGLNFALRDALADAFDWNLHGSSFISAQRARIAKDSEEWHIIESGYKKVYMPKQASIVIGDVVATGTSLEHAIKALIEEAQAQNTELKHIVFFTFGGPRTEEILEIADQMCREKFPTYQGTFLFYIEGRFAVPMPDTKLSIKLTGTDLLRTGSLLAPEFIESNYQNPLYPLERCTIYDAGSRAFWLPEYLEDVYDYWTKTLELVKSGICFSDLLNERFPELDASRFERFELKTAIEARLDELKILMDRIIIQ